MKAAEGGEAVIVTAEQSRVHEIEIDLKQRGYSVTVLSCEELATSCREFDVGVFDLSSREGNPVVVAAGLLADGRLHHVEFISPHPGIERSRPPEIAPRAQLRDGAAPAA
jgi:hypothetical protein